LNNSQKDQSHTNPAPDTVALIGVPLDEFSSFLRGPAKAPPLIRQTLHNGSSNLYAENGINLDGHPLFRDLGDMVLPGGEQAIAEIEGTIRRLVDRKIRVLALGGDHAVTYPLVSAVSAVHADLSILHFDAHPDLYEIYDGSRFSHACPFARIMETGRVRQLIQVGIRGMNDEQRRLVEKFGVTSIEMKDFRSDLTIECPGPVYLSLDMDALDPAFAPGVSHHEPGGLSTREVLRIIQSVRAPIVGADIVEYNPDRDIQGITAAAAAKFVKEIAGAMLAQTATASTPANT